MSAREHHDHDRFHGYGQAYEQAHAHDYAPLGDASKRVVKLSALVIDKDQLNRIVEAVLTKISEEEDDEIRYEQLTLANEALSQFYLDDLQPMTLSEKRFYKLLSGIIQIIQTSYKSKDDTSSTADQIVQYIKTKSALVSARRRTYSREHESEKSQFYEYVSNIIEHQEYLSNIQETSYEDLEELEEPDPEEVQDEENVSSDKLNLLSELKINENKLDDKDALDTYEYKTMSQLVEHMRNCLATNKNPTKIYNIFMESDDKLRNNLRRTIANYYGNILSMLSRRKFDISKVPAQQTKYELLCNIISISSAYFDTIEDFIKMLHYRSTVYKYINLWAIIRYKIQSYCNYKAKQIANNSSDFILAEVVSRPHSERKKLNFLHFKIY